MCIRDSTQSGAWQCPANSLPPQPGSPPSPSCRYWRWQARARKPGKATEPIAPGRRDFVESSDIIGQGRVQLEISFLREREHDDEGHTRALTTPALLREWKLPGQMQLGLMPGIALERREEEGRYTYGLSGAALEKAFSENLHGVAEIALPRTASSRHRRRLPAVEGPRDRHHVFARPEPPQPVCELKCDRAVG